jgi:hypothetical protein
MKVVHTNRHRAHDPKTFIHRGRLVDSPELRTPADIAVESDGFRRVAASIGRFAGPIGILQEGGYPCPELGENLSAFLGAIDG